MAVIGAVGYGLYTTAMRLKITDDESASMQLLLGYLGLVNAISLFPMLIFMVVMNLGNVRELTLTAFLFCFISGFFDDVISDYLWVSQRSENTSFTPYFIFSYPLLLSR